MQIEEAIMSTFRPHDSPKKTRQWTLVAALGLLALASGAASFAGGEEEHGRGEARGGRPEFARPAEGRGVPRGQVFDNRYNHGHYYPARGSVVRELPGGYRPFFYHGNRYFFAGGVWYAPGPYGFVVAAPPVGLFINVLPPFYSTVWYGGVPYYYADDVYYRAAPDMSGYTVVDPPPGADQPPGAPPSATPAEDFYIYPRNGQSQEQQAADRYECHSWASSQTGFDPTAPAGGAPPDQADAKREQYRRAMTACLEARNYSVK
jgi:hypothetical protein